MKIENKMTAVQWLIELLAKEKIAIPDYIINKAKEMEKQQITKAVDYCLASVKLSDDKTMFTATTPEQYYNETFNNEN